MESTGGRRYSPPLHAAAMAHTQPTFAAPDAGYATHATARRTGGDASCPGCLVVGRAAAPRCAHPAACGDAPQSPPSQLQRSPRHRLWPRQATSAATLLVADGAAVTAAAVAAACRGCVSGAFESLAAVPCCSCPRVSRNQP